MSSSVVLEVPNNDLFTEQVGLDHYAKNDSKSNKGYFLQASRS